MLNFYELSISTILLFPTIETLPAFLHDNDLKHFIGGILGPGLNATNEMRAFSDIGTEELEYCRNCSGTAAVLIMTTKGFNWTAFDSISLSIMI